MPIFEAKDIPRLVAAAGNVGISSPCLTKYKESGRIGQMPEGFIVRYGDASIGCLGGSPGYAAMDRVAAKAYIRHHVTSGEAEIYSLGNVQYVQGLNTPRNPLLKINEEDLITSPNPSESGRTKQQ